MHHQRIAGLSIAGAVAVLLASSAHGQDRAHYPRGALGITANVVRPVGEFHNFVDWGGGIGLYAVINFDEGRHIGLRFDGSAVLYGHERYVTTFSPTVRRVLVDVSTDNYILAFGIGPQLTLGSGPIRPYVFGTAGISYFATVSSVSGSNDSYDFASSTNFDDATVALTGGGGLLFRLSSGRHPVSVDLSAQTTLNGEAEYLRRGGITENPDGSLTLFPIRSETNFVTFRVGVAIGL